MAGFCEHGVEHFSFMKYEEFLDWLISY